MVELDSLIMKCMCPARFMYILLPERFNATTVIEIHLHTLLLMYVCIELRYVTSNVSRLYYFLTITQVKSLNLHKLESWTSIIVRL